MRSVVEMARVLRSALEERWKVKIPPEHAIWTWLVEYGTWLLNRLEVGKDGRTAYERSKGKKARLLGYEFGEGVLWKGAKAKGDRRKLELLEDGIFLGMQATTGEMIVGTKEGVHRTRSLKKKNEDDK